MPRPFDDSSDAFEETSDEFTNEEYFEPEQQETPKKAKRQPQNDYVTPRERVTFASPSPVYADIAQSGIQAVGVPEKGWLLAVVFLVIILEVSDFLQGRERNAILNEYTTAIETNRSEEVRKSQETISDLTDKLSQTTTQMTDLIDRVGQIQTRTQTNDERINEVNDELVKIREDYESREDIINKFKEIRGEIKILSNEVSSLDNRLNNLTDDILREESTK